MRKSKEFIVIKYLLIITIGSELILNISGHDSLAVIILGVYIINNQIRLYFLSEKFIPYSILGEIILSLVVCNLYGGDINIYMLPSIIDSFTIIKKSISIKFIILELIICIYLSLMKAPLIEFKSVVYIFIIVLVITYLKNESIEKKNAQELYDRLRVKEEELKEANKYLENYASSIEELTLLKERNRISRDIHDSVGHALSTTIIQLSALERLGEKEGSSLVSMLTYLRKFMSESLNEVRVAVRQLKPNEYESYEGIFRIEELIKNFSKLTGVKAILKVSKEKWELSEIQGTNLYRVVQESLSNSLRHGKATIIKVNMNFSKDGLVLSIEDNGVGCSKVENTGVGIKNIRERVEELMGEISINTKLDKGFKITVNVRREKMEVF